MNICIYAGAFGADVARVLAEQTNAVPLALSEAERSPLGDLLVRHEGAYLALPSLDVDIAQRFCDASLRTGQPVVLAFAHLRFIFVGPVFHRRSGSACFKCFWNRFRSHQSNAVEEMYIRRSGGTADAVVGHLPSHAQLAGESLVKYAGDVTGYARSLRRIDMLSGEVLETRLVPLHRCERCRVPSSDPTARFVTSLRAELYANTR